MSEYQLAKSVIVSFFGLSKDAIHIYIGFFFLFLSLLIFRKASYKLLIPGLLVSVIMEIFDLRDDFLSLAYFRWGASLHDIINTNLLPLVALSFLKFRGKINL